MPIDAEQERDRVRAYLWPASTEAASDIAFAVMPITQASRIGTALNTYQAGQASSPVHYAFSSTLEMKRNTMLKKLLLTLSAVAVLGTSATLPTAAQAQNYPDTIKQMVGKAKKEVPLVNMEQFKAGFDKKSLGLIVDVRNPDEYADGHIPGAVNVPRGLLEFTIWNHVGYPDKTDMNKQMTLYCKTGGRCALATKTLRDLGFTNVTTADMVFENWVKAGYPVAKPAK
jgi:rhodanese-related sulfurtransferase